ncbi:MAG: hypothetical protein EAX86_12200 [Candidatus Heimdallarchaeota archaeon]|nr:hypothetical protein [Candidatus Heimdallarchaeota archaeon]
MNLKEFKESIFLDHFFLMINDKIFQEALELPKIMKNTINDRIERPDTSYEGVYVFAENGTYLEFLTTAGTEYDFYLGIGMSFRSTDSLNMELLNTLFPELDLVVYNIQYSDNSPWYDAYMLQPAKKCKKINFTSWLINYHTKRTRKSIQQLLREFSSLKLTVPQCYLELMDYSIQWLPIERKFTSNSGFLNIPVTKNSSLSVEITVNPSTEQFIPVEVKADMINHKSDISRSLGDLKVATRDRELIITIL